MSATDAPRRSARMAPPTSSATQPFWDATKEERLLLQRCSACDEFVWYPREVCPNCLRPDNLEWVPSSGKGEVYAVSVQHTGRNPFTGTGEPYAVALVTVEEGPRLMTNIVGCAPDEVTVGMPVQVTWEPLADGRNLPLFQPTSA